MTVSLPDIIGEYMIAPERFGTDGVQYAGYFEPKAVAPGETANLFVFLQSTVDAPLVINVAVELPRVGKLFGSGSPVLEVGEATFELKLGRAETGLLTLPVKVADQTKPKEYPLTLELKPKTDNPTQRIRLAESRSTIDSRLIDNPVGLNLVGALGSTYVEKPVKKAEFMLNVVEEEQGTEETPLKQSYQTLFSEKEAETFRRAVQEINLRRVKLESEVTVESLYAHLFAENTTKFAEAGLPLRIGEAITLTRLMVYCCQHFLSDSNRYNGLFVPIWERAFEVEYSTADALEMICKVGYYHILKISLAMGFGLVAQAAGKQLWPLEERQAVINFIADNLETGETLEADFLYLPLLMAGTFITPKLVLDGEDARHSLALMKLARAARPDLFKDEEMAQANKLYEAILKKALG